MSARPYGDPRMKCQACRCWMRSRPTGDQKQRAEVPFAGHCVECSKVDAYREAFEVLAAKGPVDLYGPQTKARQALKVLDDAHLLHHEERVALVVGQSHALTGEGRGEFDGACARIRARLFGATDKRRASVCTCRGVQSYRVKGRRADGRMWLVENYCDACPASVFLPVNVLQAETEQEALEVARRRYGRTEGRVLLNCDACRARRAVGG